MDSVTLAEALELFKLPRTIGTDRRRQDRSASPSAASVRTCNMATKKFVSIKDDDPYTVELPRALELIKAKEELDANRTILDFPEAGIQVLNGRYGPYITDRVKNAKIPKDRDPKSLTLDECKELIAAAPARGKGRFGRFAKKTAAPRRPPRRPRSRSRRRPRARPRQPRPRRQPRVDQPKKHRAKPRPATQRGPPQKRRLAKPRAKRPAPSVRRA